MCGIIGYAGKNEAEGYLLDGLEKLEYRGYDSAGIAVINDNEIDNIKAKGNLGCLKKKLNERGRGVYGTVGIGHTRWATHGKPSDENAHPHGSMNGTFYVVHNGIIENFAELKRDLMSEGFIFKSQTDTEVISNLLEKNYNGDLPEAVAETVKQLKGSYAIAVLCRDFPEKIICARRSSPLIIGKGENENFIASDITALLKHTRDYYRLEDGEIAVISESAVKFYNENLVMIQKPLLHTDISISSAEKGGYEHFMLKEIYEQPKAVRDTLSSFLSDSHFHFDNLMLTKDEIKNISQIYIVACGSAYHVGVTGKYVFEELCRIPTQADIASEFRYRNPVIDNNALVIIISQSGETADTLAAMRNAKKKGAKIVSVINVAGSTIETESENVIHTLAGPEIAVATTKAYSCQLAVMYALAIYISSLRESISAEREKELISGLMNIPKKISEALKLENEAKKAAAILKDSEHIYFIGRGIDYAAALEASLKMKEISYIHSEAYGAGEMKHGTISLIESGTPVIALACSERLLPKTLANVKEVAARDAETVCVTQEKHLGEMPKNAFKIAVPETDELFSASIQVVPLQLLAYYTASLRGCDIDKPRNLAKSVTVE